MGIHYVFAVSVPLAVMLLDVFDTGVLSDKKRVYSAMLAVLNSAVVDSASCDYEYVRSLSYVKIVVYDLAVRFQPKLRGYEGSPSLCLP